MLTDNDLRWVGAPSNGDDWRGPLEIQAAMALLSGLPADADRSTWRERAACQATNAELFFPIGRTGEAVEHVAAAKAVCETCNV